MPTSLDLPSCCGCSLTSIFAGRPTGPLADCQSTPGGKCIAKHNIKRKWIIIVINIISIIIIIIIISIISIVILSS